MWMFNKKNVLTFSVLSFSMLSAIAVQAQQSGVQSQALTTPPQQIVSQGKTTVVDPSTVSTVAPSTGVGGANPGNANTGGVQIVSVNAAPTVNTAASSDTIQGTTLGSRMDMIKRDRIRTEVNNESLLMEKLEEGRAMDEAKRLKHIEKFKSAVGENFVDGPTSTDVGGAQSSSAQISAGATTIADHGSTATTNTTIIAPVTINKTDSENDLALQSELVVGDEVVPGLMGLGGAFKLIPSIGYRWYANGGELRASNRVTTSLALEGRVNSYLSIEGAFSYSNDAFQNVYGGAYANNGFGGGNAGFVGNSCTSGCSGAVGPEYAVRSRSNYEVNIAAKVGTQMGKVRPFGTLGIGGLFRRYNIDSAYDQAAFQQVGFLRATNHMAANLGAGADYSVSKNFNVGARLEYQAILNRQASYMNQIYGDDSNAVGMSLNLLLVF